jgi:hypothetical protein
VDLGFHRSQGQPRPRMRHRRSGGLCRDRRPPRPTASQGGALGGSRGHSDCVRCRIPANSSRLTAGPFAKQAYIHLFTRPICRASEYVTGTTLAAGECEGGAAISIFLSLASCERLDELTMDRADVTFLQCPRHCGEHCHENYPTGAGDRVLDVG